jgi:hypothetical protein
MTITDFTYLIENPDKVTDPIQINQLEDIIKEYPYFQAARSLHLKGLKNLNSYKYNKTLKNTAAYTTDRDVLFNFITSKDFLQYDQKYLQSDTTETTKSVISIAEKEQKLIVESDDKPLPQDKQDAEQILDPELFKSKEPAKKEKEILELGEPLLFDKKEKYSFTEWLQLASKKPVEREKIKKENNPKNKEKRPTTKSVKKQKFERIDKFIAQNPKIVPKPDQRPNIDVKSSAKLDKNELMTETLARVYLEQKKYKKAIQAYKILSLKYPEKSGFFADRIKAVEKIQQENK